MSRVLICTLLTGLALALPANGHAALTRPASRGGVATCLRQTGAAGVVALLGPLGRRSSAIDVVAETPGGLGLAGRVSLGVSNGCGRVAVSDTGAAVAAAITTSAGLRVPIRAALRPAGGAWGAPVTLGRTSPDASVAVAAHGDDRIVAWAQISDEAPNRPRQARILAARATAGGRFRVQALTGWHALARFGGVELAASLDDAGMAYVASTRSVPNRSHIEDLAQVEVVTAARGARFGVPDSVGSIVQSVNGLDITSAPGGDAMVVFDASDGVHVAERAAGGARFETRAKFFSEEEEVSEPAIALAPGGGAVVAWRSRVISGAGTPPGAFVVAAVRRGPGGFDAPRRVARTPSASGSGGFYIFAFSGTQGPPLDQDNGRLRAAIAPDGRLILAWLDPLDAGDGDHPVAARSVLGSLGGAFRAPTRHGSPCRAANGVAALLRADRTPGLAWTDNETQPLLSAAPPEQPVARGRVHLDGPVGTGAAPAPPRITSLAARPHPLRFEEPLRVRVRCDRACDLRGFIPTRHGPRAFGTATAAEGKTVTLPIQPMVDRNVAGRRPGRVRVVVHACTRDGGSVTTAALRVPVTRRALPSIPTPLDVRAHRVERSLLVSWRVARPGAGLSFLIEARRLRSTSSGIRGAYRLVSGHGRTEFRARLRVPPGQPIRYVAVSTIEDAPPHRARTAVGRVR